MHPGAEASLAFIRNRYWIIGGRRLVRKMKNACVTCRRYDGAPYSEPIEPSPSGRVTYTRPFGLRGVDYAGLMSARDQSGTGKVWLALFVCAATWAIHLEIVKSLAVEDFLLAFRSNLNCFINWHVCKKALYVKGTHERVLSELTVFT